MPWTFPDQAFSTSELSLYFFMKIVSIPDCNESGFAFFTIATVLGAMWAAEAWCGYWSWDPKETWSLIVWFLYAAFLHARFTRGWVGRRAAWLSIIGFAATLFCYLGVNLVLSGLHSYGGA